MGFWWTLSLLPYDSGVLVSPFSASLSLWGSGRPFLRILITVRAGVPYGTLPNVVWSWRALYALDRFSVRLEIPIICCYP